MKHKLASLLIILLLSACQENQDSTNTNSSYTLNGIVNGKVLPKRERDGSNPWEQVIGVVNPDGRISCSATLMDEKTVFTAAHCFLSGEDAQLMALTLKFRFQQVSALLKNLSEADTEEDPLTYEKKVEMVDLQLTKYLEKLAKHMGFHFGDGAEEQTLKKKIIKKLLLQLKLILLISLFLDKAFSSS